MNEIWSQKDSSLLLVVKAQIPKDRYASGWPFSVPSVPSELIPLDLRSHVVVLGPRLNILPAKPSIITNRLGKNH